MNALKWLSDDPARTRVWAGRVGVGVLAVVMFWLGGVASRAQTPTETTSASSTAGSLLSAPPAPGTALTPEPGAEDRAPSPDGPEEIAVKWVDAWLKASAYQGGAEGQTAWVESMAPYSTGSVVGLLRMSDLGKVPVGPNGKPLRAVRARQVDVVGPNVFLRVDLNNKTEMRLSTTDNGEGPLVSEFRRPQ